MRQPTLFLTVGLPCTGKTTAARRIEVEQGALRLTTDEWVKALYGHENPPSSISQRQANSTAVNRLMTHRLDSRHGTIGADTAGRRRSPDARSSQRCHVRSSDCFRCGGLQIYASPMADESRGTPPSSSSSSALPTDSGGFP
jgi:AAA domain